METGKSEEWSNDFTTSYLKLGLCLLISLMKTFPGQMKRNLLLEFLTTLFRVLMTSSGPTPLISPQVKIKLFIRNFL